MEIRTELEIAVPVSKVWRVLTDFERYAEWNPFITSISGALIEGSQLRVELSLPEGRELRFKPQLVRYREQSELCWRGHLLLPGLFDGEHFFRVEELAESRTRFVQGETFGGALMRFAGTSITRAARGFVYMNSALKRRAETDGRRSLGEPTRS